MFFECADVQITVTYKRLSLSLSRDANKIRKVLVSLYCLPHSLKLLLDLLYILKDDK